MKFPIHMLAVLAFTITGCPQPLDLDTLSSVQLIPDDLHTPTLEYIDW